MQRLYPNFIGGWGATAPQLVRLVMGVAFVLHGWPKIQNPFAWMNAMGGQGVPSFLQALAALAEFGGGGADEQGGNRRRGLEGARQSRALKEHRQIVNRGAAVRVIGQGRGTR